LLIACLNAVTADGLAGGVLERGLLANTVPAWLDLAIRGAAVAGNRVFVVAGLRSYQDAVTADGCAAGGQIVDGNATPAVLDLAIVSAAVPVVVVAVVTVVGRHAWYHKAITADVSADVRATRGAARASPAGLNAALAVAAVAIVIVAVVALNIAEVVAVAALLGAHRGSCRGAIRASEAGLNVAVGVAAVAILVVAVVAIAAPREVDREGDSVAADLGADVLASWRAASAEPSALDLAIRGAATQESEGSELTRRR